MSNFVWLLFAHYIGDYALQSTWMADNKGKHPYVLFCHCMVWTATVSIALQYLGMLDFWRFFVLLSGHYIMDAWKSRQPRQTKFNNGKWWHLYLDQAWHIVQLLLVYNL